MTFMITCKECGKKKPEKTLGKEFKYLQNRGVFYCPHVVVHERKTKSYWSKTQ